MVCVRTLSAGDLGSEVLQCLISLCPPNLSKLQGHQRSFHPAWVKSTPLPARTPPSKPPPSIFNTRDTSPLPQHGAHMPVILNLIKETLETGNTRSCERRCNGSLVLGTFSSFSVFFLSNRAVSYFVFKNPLVLTGSRRPPFLPRSVCLQKWKKQSIQVQSAWGRKRNMYMLVCRKR